jgi:lipoprotein Spr
LDAQPNVNIEKITDNYSGKSSLKFIEGIELTPGKPSGLTYQINKPLSNFPAGKYEDIERENSPYLENCSALQFKYGIILNREVESITNLNLYNFIDDWMGTRYHYGGIDREGIDCSAFTGKLYSKVYGIELPRTAKEQFSACKKLTQKDMKEGDLVFFHSRRAVNHVGIYLGNNFFIHSSTHDGVTVSSLDDPYYSRKYLGGGAVIN